MYIGLGGMQYIYIQVVYNILYNTLLITIFKEVKIDWYYSYTYIYLYYYMVNIVYIENNDNLN